MAISKLKHGQDITMKLLNDIIGIVNALEEALKKTEEWNSTIGSTVDSFRQEVDLITTRYDSTLNALPNLQELVTTFIEAKKAGIIWTDANVNTITNLLQNIYTLYDITSTDEEIRAALEEYLDNITYGVERLQIFRGTTADVIARPIIDKQILFDYEKGTMYVDQKDINGGNAQRIAYGNLTNEAQVMPTISIISDPALGTNYWQVSQGSTTTVYEDVPVQGPMGSQGMQGPAGPQGIKGEQGIQGPRGIQGPKGSDGATTLLDIKFSDYYNGVNSTDVYDNQAYMGIKIYTDQMTSDQVASIPRQWLKIRGEVYHPHITEDGYLYWSEEPNADIGTKLYIKGPKGDRGETGAPPSIELVFTDSNGNPTTISRNYTLVNNIPKYSFNLDPLKGPKGDPGQTGAAGSKGDKGDKPTLSFTAQKAAGDIPYALTSVNVGGIDYQINFYIPEGPEGPAGRSITNAFIDSGILKLRLSDDSLLNVGNVIGPKGDKGTIATFDYNATVTIYNPSDPINASRVPTATTTLLNPTTNLYKLELDLPQGSPGPQGPKGDKGDKGDDGKSLSINGSVEDLTALAALVPTSVLNDAYILADTSSEYYGHLYVFNGTAFIRVGLVQGPKGDTGDNGANGTDGREVVVRKGTAAIEWKYSTEADSSYRTLVTLASITGPAGADGIDGDEIILQVAGGYIQWKYDNPSSNWANLIATSSLVGAQGEPGDPGTLIHVGTYSPSAQATPNSKVNDLYFNSSTQQLYKKTANTGDYGVWELLASLAGQDGIDGAKGEPGVDGINGSPGNIWYYGNDAPTAALPEANDGDLYLQTGGANVGNVYRRDSGAWNYTTPIANIRGASGTNGSNGQRGSLIYSNIGLTPGGANGAPTSGLMSGDMYISTTNGSVWSYSGSQWVPLENLSLKPADGLRGNTWTTGTTTTPTGDFISGDMYLNTSSYALSKYNGTTWDVIGNIKGTADSSAARIFYGTVVGSYAANDGYSITNGILTITTSRLTPVDDYQVNDIYINSHTSMMYRCTSKTATTLSFLKIGSIGSSVRYTSENLSTGTDSFSTNITNVIDVWHLGFVIIQKDTGLSYQVIGFTAKDTVVLQRQDLFMTNQVVTSCPTADGIAGKVNICVNSGCATRYANWIYLEI